MLYEHYVDLAAGLNQVIQSLQAHPDARVREQVAELLERVDLLHREGLVRLADMLRRVGAEEAFTRAAEDPVVRILLGLYDIVDLGVAGSSGATGFIPLEQLRRHRTTSAEHGNAPPETRT